MTQKLVFGFIPNSVSNRFGGLLKFSLFLRRDFLYLIVSKLKDSAVEK